VPAPRRGRPPSGRPQAVLDAALAILREKGVGKLTTREVAERAGVSEGTVFYHFTDRVGLLTAVIEDRLRGLSPLQDSGIQGDDVAGALAGFFGLLGPFLGDALVVMIAAQSDPELRRGLAHQLAARDMGPHRGIGLLAGYLAEQQRQGLVRDDLDAATLAQIAYSTAFLAAMQEQMGGAGTVPTEALAALFSCRP
jgi:AcrR family transcriptional regulator